MMRLCTVSIYQKKKKNYNFYHICIFVEKYKFIQLCIDITVRITIAHFVDTMCCSKRRKKTTTLLFPTMYYFSEIFLNFIVLFFVFLGLLLFFIVGCVYIEYFRLTRD